MSRLEQLLTMQAQSPQEPFIRFALAKEYEKLGQHEQALGEYLYLAQEQADYIGTYYHLGKLFELLQQPKAAFEAYKKGMLVAKNAGDQHSFSELAGAKLNLGDDEDFE